MTTESWNEQSSADIGCVSKDVDNIMDFEWLQYIQNIHVALQKNTFLQSKSVWLGY